MIHDERIDHRSHPAPLNPIPTAEWKFGCGASICMDFAFTAEAFFCQPCATGYVARNLERAGGNGMDAFSCWILCFVNCCFCPFYPCALGFAQQQIRQAAASRWLIKEAKEECCGGYCFSCCCPLCSLCQVKNELEQRKEWNGSMCTQQSPNYTIEQWQHSYGPSIYKVGIMGAPPTQNQPHQQQMYQLQPQPQAQHQVSYQNNHQPFPQPMYAYHQQQQPPPSGQQLYHQQQSQPNMAFGVPPQ